MKLNDFSSVLQLGVGLHTGTVLLQSVAEFASSPMTIRLARLAKIAELRCNAKGGSSDSCEVLHEQALDLQADLETKKVQFFNEYRIAAKLNACVAVLLFAVLAWAAIDSDAMVSVSLAAFLIGLSFAPAAISLIVLWRRWQRNTESLRKQIDELDRRLLNN
jgi:hypothetical protein